MGTQRVVTGSQSAPVFTPVEAAFDLVTAIVGDRVERGWLAAAKPEVVPVRLAAVVGPNVSKPPRKQLSSGGSRGHVCGCFQPVGRRHGRRGRYRAP
jgi:hypothetical protein